MQDPCRPGVKDAVQLCQKSGVKVLLVYVYDVESHLVPIKLLRSFRQVQHVFVQVLHFIILHHL